MSAALLTPVLHAQAAADAQAQPAPTQNAPAAPQNAPAAQPTAATPHGTVLFERHESPAGDAPAQDAQPVPAQPAAAPGTSSVRRRSTRQGLQRRGTVDPATGDSSTAAPSTADLRDGPPAAATPCGTETASRDTAASPCDPTIADVSDAERSAPQIVQAALDLHLNLQTGNTAVHAKLVVRNSSGAPITRLPLQISSSLQWQGVRAMQSGTAAVSLPLHQHRITTDADHTGYATELIATLPGPLASGATVSLDLFYGGTLGTSTERLLRLGAPEDRAVLSDWDTVSDRFTGLRGFGNVLWMPAAAPVALFGATADFVAVADTQRLRNESSHASLRLTVESSGPAPGAAFFLGKRQPLTAVTPTITPEVGTTAASAATPGSAAASSSSSAASSSSDADETEEEQGEAHLYTAEFPLAAVGAELPSIFLTAAPEQAASLRVATDNAPAAEAYGAAADRLRPMLEEWLSPQPARPLDVLDLPLAGAQPFAADSLLVAPLQPAEAKELAPVLAYPLAAAWLPADTAPWFAQGLPEFLRLLALERNGNRDAAQVSLAAAAPELVRYEALHRAAAGVSDTTAATTTQSGLHVTGRGDTALLSPATDSRGSGTASASLSPAQSAAKTPTAPAKSIPPSGFPVAAGAPSSETQIVGGQSVGVSPAGVPNTVAQVSEGAPSAANPQISSSLADSVSSTDAAGAQAGDAEEAASAVVPALPLAQCVAAACARTKGASVFAMLRQMAGDDALKQALAGWIGTRSNGAGSPETDAATFERLLQAAAGKDLHWFFADWVDRDPGLPDLAIVNVAPRRIERGTVTNIVPTERRPVGGPIGPEPVAQPGDPTQQERATTASRNALALRDGSWLIAVEVQNNGDAAAEVPVTVRGSGLQNALPLRIAAHSRATIRVPFETAPEEVTVNDGTTPERRSTTHHRTITLPETLR